ncbi:uncharacterized protein EV422DRAFT_519956 [Fimicolochytrium jonesii]|uniref:uncharacterized protein n=1 Tax=Fimicolochytrium jonesii TaxID=1396493 RepID=UPI0022FE6BC1|nr:uncharacterized protein EV422DRAFT_519956 [Fimicolochytrium jonesii]KAI8824395.1 hypothetical protein EV422DRAFT_519956 [Fimicolochytrium jonesii]
MVLEATILVLDNSEWMRNGDYTPSRMEAQADSVTLLFNAKTQSNPENTVGLMTMAGKSPDVLVTLTPDIGKILTALHHIDIKGNANLSTGVQIAQLALKHRQNRNQRQRIIVFVGSPLKEDEKTLVRLGKKLKKNNVAVDIVNFGEELENTQKLQAFVDAVKSNDNSHLVSVPPGPHILSDILLASPIISGEDGAPPGFSNAGAFEFGVDPNLDPELAMALRISMEEEQARQQTTTPGAPAAGASEPMQVDAAYSGAGAVAAGGEEDDMLAQALAMSLGQQEQTGMDVDAAPPAATGANVDMNSILGSLPGVNLDDPRLRAAMGGAKKEGEGEKKDEKKK